MSLSGRSSPRAEQPHRAGAVRARQRADTRLHAKHLLAHTAFALGACARFRLAPHLAYAAIRSRYQRTVFFSPEAKLSAGFQPSSRWILPESMA